MNAPENTDLQLFDDTGTGPVLARRRKGLLRERHQHPKVMDHEDKWRLAYWDNTDQPRKKRGKVWSKSIVPIRRKAQQLADDFMAGINERNNAPHLRRDTAETFAALVEMYRQKIAPHLKNSTRMNYNFFLKTYLVPAWGGKRLAKLRLVDLQDFVNGLKLAPKTIPC